MKRLLSSVAVISVFALTAVGKCEDEWPQFRGPNGDGHSSASELPLRWHETQNIRWKTAILGAGHSSPVISGNAIWLTTAEVVPLSAEAEKKKLSQIKNPRGLQIARSLSLHAICIERETGKLRHKIKLFEVDAPGPKHSLNSYASPTPVLEKGRLYCHFGTFGTVCLNTKTARVEWRNQELKVDCQNGAGSSPIGWKHLLIIHFDGIDEQFVAAFNKLDGKVAWKAKRTGEMHERKEFRKAYCTPTIIEDSNRPQLISPGANWLYSYDPRTGKELWRAHYGGLGFSTVPRPIVGHGMVYVCTSYLKSKLLAIRHDGTGDVTKTHIAWDLDRGIPSKPSSLLIGNELYFVSDKGIAVCLDAKTGKQHWQQRLDGNFSASPLFADGRIHFFNHEGTAFVIEPSTEYQLLAINKLDGGNMASPIAVGKALFVRTETHLYRIERE